MEIFQFLYFTGARLAEIAGVVVDALLGMTPGYTHPEMDKAEERHKSICREHLNKCLDL